ncbi:hypothetical protein SLEP1_g54818 [Rubroshorea leprosula]|uniref:RNase H type-1 domain-containing protein n=1 Tax=Rubroshorea leprosula TaxID=152421 RepID=A0AAV5MEK1_9ROSI|nr:hypothetical protein SLEP1_g54818 [Rubroshorea leprosula]
MGLALADFMIECVPTALEEAISPCPLWPLYVDGASNLEGSGVGAILMGPDGYRSEHALCFPFPTTNNTIEYKALIFRLKLAVNLKVDKIPKDDNRRADELSKLASTKEMPSHITTYVEALETPKYINFDGFGCARLSINPSFLSCYTLH